MSEPSQVVITAKLPAALVTAIDRASWDKQCELGPKVRVSRAATVRSLIEAGLAVTSAPAAPEPAPVRVRRRKPYREADHG